MTDKTKHFRGLERNEDDRGISSAELDYILEVNKKSVEIQIEVEKQNSEVLDKLDKIIERQDGSSKSQIISVSKAENTETVIKQIAKQIEDLDKNIFKLTTILSLAGVGAILAAIKMILQLFLH